MKIFNIRLSFLILLLCLFALGGYIVSARQKSPSGTLSTDLFQHSLLQRAIACAEARKVDLATNEAVAALLQRLNAKSYVVEKGSDDLRSQFVHAQACIEHVLAHAYAAGEVLSLFGAIHTPTPATPLCSSANPAEIQLLLDPSLRDDPDKVSTVRSRQSIVRAYLEKGASLFAIYPRGGLEQRSEEQQNVYRHLLEQYPDTLFDLPVPIEQMDDGMVGATYLFRSSSGRDYAFSIQARQANAPSAEARWALWFGPLEDETVKARVDRVCRTLQSYGAPDLRTLLH